MATLPEEVRISARTGTLRGVYVRVRGALPDGIEGPAYQARKSKGSESGKRFLFRAGGRWYLGSELVVDRSALRTEPDDATDPLKIGKQPGNSPWSLQGVVIEAVAQAKEEVPDRLEVHSKFKNLREGLRRQGTDFVWKADSGKLYLWKSQATDTWHLSEGAPGTDFARKVYASAPANGHIDPRLAAWSGDVDGMGEVWWDENASFDAGLWRDPVFPPSDKSLGSTTKEIGPVEWIPGRALDRDPSNDVLFDRIEPSDLVQGSIGDCWLIAAVAAVAEFPEIVEALFPEGRSQLPPDGKHEVKLFDIVMNKWITLVVDEFIPCKPRKWYELNATPVFSQPVGHELWVLLLEKAFAKMYGGYQNLKGGRAVFAWQALTGVVDQRIFTRRGPSGPWDEYSLDLLEQVSERKKGRPHSLPLVRCEDDPSFTNTEFWERLLEWGSDHVLAASINDHHTDDFSLPNGLIPDHAYSVIQVKQSQGFRLIQLRNPHGSGIEWNGAWSDNDGAWAKYPQVAEELEYTAADDGTFWMAFEDLAREFDTVSLCPHKLGKDFARFMTSASNMADDGLQTSTERQRLEIEDRYQYEEEGSGRCSDRCTNQCLLL